MKTITKAAFSRECGVSKAAIDGAIKRGSVITTNDGKVNLDHRITREYKSKQKNKKKKDIVEKTKPIKKKIVAAVADPDEELPTGEEEEEQFEFSFSSLEDITPENIKYLTKTKIDTLDKYEAALTKKQKREEDRNKLIPRSYVAAVFSKLYSVDINELKEMEDRLAPAICGIFKVDDGGEESIKTRKLLNKEITKSLRHIKRIIDEFLKQTEEKK